MRLDRLFLEGKNVLSRSKRHLRTALLAAKFSE